jgi:hypothetical protein
VADEAVIRGTSTWQDQKKSYAAGIRLDDNRVVLTDDSLAAAASACRDFIERLDLAAQARA